MDIKDNSSRQIVVTLKHLVTTGIAILSLIVAVNTVNTIYVFPYLLREAEELMDNKIDDHSTTLHAKSVSRREFSMVLGQLTEIKNQIRDLRQDMKER